MYAGQFVVSSRRRHTRCALVTGVQTCALPIYTEFLLPQALVKADGFVCRCAAIFAEDLRGLECAQIGRGEKDFRALLLDMCCEPATERGCLLSAEVAQGHVCVTH